MAISTVEKNTIKKTSLEVPYGVQKDTYKAKKAMSKIADKGIGPKITEFPLYRYKNSDTVFILGSGGSINDITSDEWKHIDQHDSIGLNRWPIHDFVPTYHVFEIRLDEKNKNFTKKYWDLLNYKRQEYENVPMILKDVRVLSEDIELSHIPRWLRGELIVSCDTGFGSILDLDSSIEKNNLLLRYLDEKNYFERLRSIYRMRASVSYLIHLSIILGYQNIVLCGVDMVDSKYFFDASNYVNADIPIPKHNINNDSSDTHRTNDESVGELTLEKVIYSLENEILAPKNISLYVENTRSALHPKIPVYHYE